MTKYALIKNGVVEKTIVSDQSFINSVCSNYDHCVRIDNFTPVSELWSKEGEDDVYEVPLTQEYWSKEGESDVQVDPEDETWTHHPADIDETWTYHEGYIGPSVGDNYDGEEFSKPS